MLRGIGMNCNDEIIDGHLERLEKDLTNVQQAGFDAYEFSPVAFPIVHHGQIYQAELNRVKVVLARYPIASLDSYFLPTSLCISSDHDESPVSWAKTCTRESLAKPRALIES